jgi:hypothetical protein
MELAPKYRLECCFLPGSAGCIFLMCMVNTVSFRIGQELSPAVVSRAACVAALTS